MLRAACAVVSLLSLPLFVSGCTLATTAGPVEEAGVAIRGHVHGGQQPVAGANVYLLAANSTGYPTATTGASKSLMKFVSGQTSLDISSGPTNGFYYATTDANGNFSIGGDYSCTSGQQVYLYVLGGNPGAGTNSAAGFLAALGNCPAAGNFAASMPFLWVNEVTTVAAAYSMSAFAYDALHVSSPSSALSKTNLQNAFANAGNVVDISSGTAWTNLPNNVATTDPTFKGLGAPNTINTLANILASCVNTNGPSSTSCSTLFTLAKTNGTAGTAPTDTATAAINIAHNQGSNASALFSLLGTTQAFVPSYTDAPADFSMPIHFSSPDIGSATGVAIDASGNAWIASVASGSISTSVTGFSEMSPQGTHLTNVTGTAYSANPQNILVTAEGDVWADIGQKYIEYVPGGSTTTSTASYAVMDFTEYQGSIRYLANRPPKIYLDGSYAPGTNDMTASTVSPLAVDGTGKFWAVNRGSGTLTGWTSSGSLVTPTTAGYSVGTPYGLAVDQSNNIWVGTSTNSGSAGSGYGVKLNSAGTTLATYSDSTAFLLENMYVDGANTVFAYVSSSTESLVQFDTSGNLLQVYGRVPGASTTGGHLVAFDGSGNMWVVAGNGVYQMLGISTPVVTPIAANLVSPYSTPASKPQ